MRHKRILTHVGITWQTWVNQRLPLMLLQVAFTGLTLFLVWLLPFNSAPDEATHYNYSTKFILLHHRLPIAGVDDKEVYKIPITQTKQCGGLVTTQATYAVFPAVPYVIAAFTAWATNRLLATTYYFGARLASLGWGLVFLSFLYLLAWKLSKRRLVAFSITLSIAFIPQVIYISAYNNADIYSLAVSAMVAYSLTCWLERSNPLNEWGLAGALGILAVTKYNYFVYWPYLILVILLNCHLKKIPSKSLAIKIIVSMLVIACPWYIRNLYYYRDPLGESYFLAMMARYNPSHPVPFSNPIAFSSWAYLARQGWFQEVFDSFFARFGYMNISLPWWDYENLRGVIAIWASVLSMTVFLQERRTEKWLVIGALSFLALNIILIGWNSLRIDYQAQGRYLFPSIIPIASALTILCRRNIQYLAFVLMLICIVMPLLIASIHVLVMAYR